MTASAPYEPEQDDVPAHRYADTSDVYFAVATGYGKGAPNHFVTLDELPRGGSWWLDADQAEELGRQLMAGAARCRESARRAEGEAGRC